MADIFDGRPARGSLEDILLQEALKHNLDRPRGIVARLWDAVNPEGSFAARWTKAQPLPRAGRFVGRAAWPADVRVGKPSR